MNIGNEKCVVVLDEQLPAGVAANTAAILGITMGMKRPGVVGGDVRDGAGRVHAGIIQFPVPVLKSSAEGLRDLREKLFTAEYKGITAVDFSELAQGCRTYEEYTGKMAECGLDGLRYLGIILCGEKRLVNRLTGSLPLLR